MYLVIYMKQKHEQEIALDIDYDLFTTEEIVKIFNFFSLISRTKHQRVNKTELLDGYKEFKNIINNKSLQKQYERKFEKVTGISIYQLMKSLEN